MLHYVIAQDVKKETVISPTLIVETFEGNPPIGKYKACSMSKVCPVRQLVGVFNRQVCPIQLTEFTFNKSTVSFLCNRLL